MAKKLSPVKEKANRLKRMIDHAINHDFIEVFGVQPSYGMIAERLGYKEDRFKSVVNGNVHMQSIEKLANELSTICSKINPCYVTKGEKNMNIENKQIKENELEIIDMDEDMDELVPIEEEVSDNTSVEEPAEEPVNDGSIAEENKADANANGSYDTAFDRANKSAGNSMEHIKSINPSIPKTKIRTAKDKWADDAIAVGVKDLDDHFMQTYKDGKMYLFKEPEGKLPYRQEILDVQALGVGKPTVINYEDDKAKFVVNYAIVLTGMTTMYAASAEDVGTKLHDMLGKAKFEFDGKEMILRNVFEDIV